MMLAYSSHDTKVPEENDHNVKLKGKSLTVEPSLRHTCMTEHLSCRPVRTSQGQTKARVASATASDARMSASAYMPMAMAASDSPDCNCERQTSG